MSWNPSDAQLDQVKTAWTVDGKSASQIVAMFPNQAVTRNVIIGVIHRRGWAKAGGQSQSGPSRAARPPVERAERAPAAAKPPTPPKKAALVLDPTKFVEFDQLGPHHCRYPVDEGGKNGMYCGALPNESPYCDGHASIVYQPQQPRKIKRPR